MNNVGSWVLRSLGTLVVLASILVGASVSSRAAPVTFAYEGVVSSSSGTSPVFATFLGQSMTVEYTFDSETPDSTPSSIFGAYNDTISSFTATVGGYTATDLTVQIIVFDSGSVDQYIIGSNTITGPAIGGAVPTDFAFNFENGSPSVFSSDELPIVQPDPSDFGTVFLELNFFSPSGSFGSIRAENFSIVEAPSSISEPSALAFLGVSAAVFAMRRRKRSG